MFSSSLFSKKYELFLYSEFSITHNMVPTYLLVILALFNQKRNFVNLNLFSVSYWLPN